MSGFSGEAIQRASARRRPVLVAGYVAILRGVYAVPTGAFRSASAFVSDFSASSSFFFSHGFFSSACLAVSWARDAWR